MPGELTAEELLLDTERVWVLHYHFLLKRGYRLRPRYSPDWVPSWGLKTRHPEHGEAEDSHPTFVNSALDATEIRTDRKVVIKRGTIPEASLAMYLHSRESEVGENKTVPILDLFPVPGSDGEVFIVMPMLQCFGNLPFRRMGEFVEAMHQFLKGMVFMHAHNVAHRDACFFNLCMDVSHVIPKGFHFVLEGTHNGLRREAFRWRYRSVVTPVQYYFIDFDLSSRYPPGQRSVRTIGVVGQDRTVPEHVLKIPYDPFKVDVYQLGNALKKVVLEYEGLEWALGILNPMTEANGDDRPTSAQALKCFEDLLASFTKKDLKRRIWLKNTHPQFRFRIKYFGWNPDYL